MKNQIILPKTFFNNGFKFVKFYKLKGYSVLRLKYDELHDINLLIHSLREQGFDYFAGGNFDSTYLSLEDDSIMITIDNPTNEKSEIYITFFKD